MAFYLSIIIMADRQAELDRLKKESEGIKAHMWKIRTQMNKLNQEIHEKHDDLDEMDEKCFKNGDKTCISHIDGYLVALNSILRKNFKAKMDKNNDCFEKVTYSLRPNDEFQWDIKSQESLNEYKKFFECARPYYEEGISYLYDELSLTTQVHKKLSEMDYDNK